MNKYERRLAGIKKARRVLGIYRARSPFTDYYEEDGEYEKVLRKTRTVCSCWMCGNPRKRGELTKQELIVNETVRE